MCCAQFPNTYIYIHIYQRISNYSCFSIENNRSQMAINYWSNRQWISHLGVVQKQTPAAKIEINTQRSKSRRLSLGNRCLRRRLRRRQCRAGRRGEKYAQTDCKYTTTRIPLEDIVTRRLYNVKFKYVFNYLFFSISDGIRLPVIIVYNLFLLFVVVITYSFYPKKYTWN